MTGSNRPVALVTGASRGIGRAIAEELGRTHHVHVGGRDSSAVAEVVSGMPSASPWIADLTGADLPPMPDELDVLVHSAGVHEVSSVIEHEREQWDRVFATNVFAVATLTRLALPALRSRRGVVIVVNSSGGIETLSGLSVYCASKHALRAFTDVLRKEERGNGVRVSSVHPGPVATDMFRDITTALGQQYDPESILQPGDVAVAVRTVVDMPEHASVESLLLRPGLSATGSIPADH